MNKTVQEFITLHANDNVQELALQRLRYPEIEDWQWVLQQIAGRQLTQKKLPSIAKIEGWHYPVRLSLEQCSSERTARYKVEMLMSFIVPKSTTSEESKPLDSVTLELCNSGTLKIADLTGGFGIDTYFLSQLPNAQVDYVEQNEDLCHIAEHNFTLTHRPVTVHNTTAEEFLCKVSKFQSSRVPEFNTNGLLNSDSSDSVGTIKPFNLLYLDPARRSWAGQKVFRLQDCTPNVLELLPQLLRVGQHIMLKLSPMIDIDLLLKQLPNVQALHILAVSNEVKEVLVLIDNAKTTNDLDTQITCTNLLHEGQETFTFTLQAERELSTLNSQLSTINFQLSTINYLFEPNAAIMKAGAFKTVAARYGCQPLDANTHLYTASHPIADFPGRKFQVVEVCDKAKQKMLRGQHFNVLTRNYPIIADKLQKQLGIISGGTDYIIGTKINNKPIILHATLA